MQEKGGQSGHRHSSPQFPPCFSPAEAIPSLLWLNFDTLTKYANKLVLRIFPSIQGRLPASLYFSLNLESPQYDFLFFLCCAQIWHPF
ncbi:hypothetical protein CJJ18_03275 [Candidatus Williamhamiltonella defendens]|uniref:Uncharacterized protein n=1 Tax=Candidatus Williamhamiltonella defendens TaxID=138072 RepID=A0AAC9VF08_9ENTR|nr:hypothetical protein CJJ18_03275 [Candidatus Hamiltonella defensa]AWK16219.1 hypothetical protein CCS40_03295 [Candidatus Hamiltonella defensa]